MRNILATILVVLLTSFSPINSGGLAKPISADKIVTTIKVTNRLDSLINSEYKIREIPIRSPLPIKSNYYISSDFGMRLHPILKRRLMHKGIDFAVSKDTPVESTANGVVVKTKHSFFGHGNRVLIKHSNGYSTLYSHLSEILVHPGDTVSARDTIGLSGNTGLSTGPHLHYEIKKDNKSIDPKEMMGIYNIKNKLLYAAELKKIEQWAI